MPLVEGAGVDGKQRWPWRTCPKPGTAPPTVRDTHMQSILDETQDVELLLATVVTAAGYVIGAAAFLAALL